MGEQKVKNTAHLKHVKPNIVVELSKHVVFYIQLQQTHFKVATQKGNNQTHNILI